MSLVSGGAAVLVLAGVFWAAVAQEQKVSFRDAGAKLDIALKQVASELQRGLKNADWEEVRAGDPELAVEVKSASGQVVGRAGAFELPNRTANGPVNSLGGRLILVKSKNVTGFDITVGMDRTTDLAANAKLELILTLMVVPLASLIALATWIASGATYRSLDALTQQAETLSGDVRSLVRLEPRSGEFAPFVGRLNRFIDNMHESYMRQERLVQDVAHELRTPLAVIRGKIEATLNRPRAAEEYAAALKTTLAEAERLSDLAETLLQSATHEDKQAGVVQIADVLESAHARWVDRFAAAHVGLNLTSEPCFASISPEAGGIILDNLLSNALRQSQRDTECFLRSQCEAGWVTIEVEDQGGGVPPGLEDKIFDRFTRGSGKNASVAGGYGLGLSICRRLVEDHGGSVRFENRGRGAAFIVRLRKSTGI